MAETNLFSFIWSIAEVLRGPYRENEYGGVILPFTILRRLDCTLEPTKNAALAELAKRTEQGLDPAPFLPRITGYNFYNKSPLDFKKLLADPENIQANVLRYAESFSDNVAEIFTRYDFETQVRKLSERKMLYRIVQKFAEVDMHPDVVTNADRGSVFENLIRKFAEARNEKAGDHFTPREVIKLMVNLLFLEDEAVLTKPGTIRTIYDPTAGTGGMLSVAEEHLKRLNPDARLVAAGQEFNDESYAICKSDMLIKGQDVTRIAFGNTLTEDKHKHETFDYGISNPPFGVDWGLEQAEVQKEHAEKGFNGRFGPGLPRSSDGALLFLLHLISKMRPVRTSNGVTDGGGRVAIVLNGSPLFTGGAGSGESEIRKWVIESDLLEAIISLPTDMFYNTGISTYVWVLSNHKSKARKGKIQLVNGVEFFQKMKKSLGNKRKELGEADIETITKLYGSFEENEYSKIFDLEDFGYWTITVERPLQLAFEITNEKLDEIRENKTLSKMNDLGALVSTLENLPPGMRWMSRTAFVADMKQACNKVGLTLAVPQLKAIVSVIGEHDDDAEICLDPKGRVEPDPDLRDTENVPLNDDIHAYFEREVLPHVPDAWIDHDKTKKGFEIPFTRHFYKFIQPRSLEEIDADLKVITDEILFLLRQVTHES